MKTCTTFLIVLFSFLFAHGQGVGIGTNMPDSSALLDLSSTTQGMLMPRMTTPQRNAIVDPALGLQVFNLDDHCIDIYDGETWIKNCGMKQIGNDTVPTWQTAASFSEAAREQAVSFSVGDKAYVATGLIGSAYLKDLWEYNAVQNTWMQKADLAGEARYGAVAFSINTKGYLGTGAAEGGYLNDFWEYDPAMNTWVQKVNLPASQRYGAIGFSINGRGYIGLGKTSGPFMVDLWEYNPELNAFTTKAFFGGNGRLGAVAFTIDNIGYVGTGLNMTRYNDFWAYNPSTNNWTPKAPFGGTARYKAVGFTLNGMGYIGTGNDNTGIRKDFWKYDPTTNSWTQAQDFPGNARMGATAFTCGSSAFIGNGIDAGIYFLDFWKYSITGPVYSSILAETNPAGINNGIWTKDSTDVFLSTEGNVGIGTQEPSNSMDIHLGSARTGTHPSARPLYVTGDIQESSQGIEIRHSNGQQGIGLGQNTIYATGSNNDQNLGLLARGTNGALLFSTNNTERMRISGEGFLGIGMNAPHAPLQFSDQDAPRKLVLKEVVNNNLEFFGFGVSSNSLRYQVPMSGNHSFFVVVQGGINLEVMRITGNGNIGIHNFDPHAPLHFNDNTNQNKKIILSELIFNDHQYYGFGVNPDILRYQVAAESASHVFYAGQSNSSSKELLRITGTGQLQFPNLNGNRKIVLYGAPNDHEYYGFGINASALRYQVDQESSSHVFYAATGPNTSKELMRITGNGNVGIGISNPSNSMDIHLGSARTGTHPSARPLYVTGDIQESSQGIEFRHSNGQQGIGLGQNTIYATGSNNDQNLGLLARGTNGALKFSTNNLERMRIDGNGFVGIGINNPHAPLQFSNQVTNRKIVFSEFQNDDHQFIGFGLNSGVLRYQVANEEANHVFYAGQSNSSSKELLRIKGNGNVTLSGLVETEAFQEPISLGAGFSNFLQGHAPVSFYKDKMGVVHLRGLVTRVDDPDGKVIFTLPSGYRPIGNYKLVFSVINSDTTGRIDITNDGNVTVIFGVPGWINLSEISFRAN